MEEVNPLKETFLLGTLNVGLPTVDVYSDLALTTKLYLHVNKHYIYATSLLIPFFINYALGWRAWYKSKRQKKYTWIFALLASYPQLVACRVIWLFWRRPAKAGREKKHFERNVIENEVFTEAVPSTLIMTFLFVVFYFADRSNLEVLVGNRDDPGSYGWYLFLVTFSSSALSAGLGLAKCLKVRSFLIPEREHKEILMYGNHFDQKIVSLQ